MLAALFLFRFQKLENIADTIGMHSSTGFDKLYGDYIRSLFMRRQKRNAFESKNPLRRRLPAHRNTTEPPMAPTDRGSLMAEAAVSSQHPNQRRSSSNGGGRTGERNLREPIVDTRRNLIRIAGIFTQGRSFSPLVSSCVRINNSEGLLSISTFFCPRSNSIIPWLSNKLGLAAF